MKILSGKQQLLLCFLFQNDRINFDNQNVFFSKRSFKKSVSSLLRSGFIIKLPFTRKATYNITIRGRLFVKLLFIFQNS